MRIYDREGHVVGPGRVGDIYVRMQGASDFTYIGKDDLRRSIERDGLITAGDAGYLDEDGYQVPRLIRFIDALPRDDGWKVQRRKRRELYMKGLLVCQSPAMEQYDSVLVAILSGEGGRAFSAGADLKEMALLDASGHSPAFDDMDKFNTAAQCSKPVIAAIDGFALAGGMELALMCDIRIATEQSTFACPNPNVACWLDMDCTICHA